MVVPACHPRDSRKFSVGLQSRQAWAKRKTLSQITRAKIAGDMD
jgi:hypothetical protein